MHIFVVKASPGAIRHLTVRCVVPSLGFAKVVGHSKEVIDSLQAMKTIWQERIS